MELLFLASEFFIHNRTAAGAQHILEVMSSKEKWEIQELHDHEELRMYSIELEVYIEFLIDKGFISIVESKSKNELINHRDYKVQ